MPDGSLSIALYRERSVTDVINATFQFLRAHFKPLAKGLLLLAGPALIFANIVALFAADPQATATGGIRPGLFLVQLTFTLVGSVFAMAVTIGAVQISHVEGPAALTTQRLWTAIQTHGLALLGRQIQIGLIIMLGGIFTGAAFGGAMMGLGAGGGSAVLAFVLGGTFFLLFLGFLFYAGPTFMLLFPGQVDAERPISVMRCMRLIKGRWGQTLGVWLLATIITMVLFSVGWMPRFVLNFLRGLGSNPTGTTGLILSGGIAGVANTLAPAVTYTAITLQYYNLVEQKEQVSLEQEVGRMEQEASDTPSTAHTSARAESDSAPDAPGVENLSSEAESDDDRRWQGDAPNP
jgi:hypothetical protein